MANHLQIEVDNLKRFQSKTPFLRPIIDEILDPVSPRSAVMQYLDSELLTESKQKRLTRPEIKQVAKCVLDVLRVLHKEGMVHTGTLWHSPSALLDTYHYRRRKIRQHLRELRPR